MKSFNHQVWKRVWTGSRWLGAVVAILVLSCLIIKNGKNDSSRLEAGRGYFQLAHAYRHGIGEFYKRQQKLDIDATVIESGADILAIDDVWTQNAKFATDNPLAYKFDKIAMKQSALYRLQDRNPAFVESYINGNSVGMAAWTREENILAPDVTDRDTVISLALMSSNAYVEIPNTGDWRNVTGGTWNESQSTGYGWDGDGIRGHVFVNSVEDIVVIAIKGTSAQGIPGSGDDTTTVNDKINDNLLFSCCCARVSYLWTTVCDCYTKSYTCNERCLEQELRRKDRYYTAAMDIYKDVWNQYPNSTIWMTGHSLGGALASLLGRTFGLPTVTFEAPGEALAAHRLHLPFPPGLPDYMEGIWHFGHTADPIFMGTCNGASSSCSLVGYAMETACHTGRVCQYDVVRDKGWHVNMWNHRIHTVIDGVLTEYDEPARCVEPEPCVDCFNWKFTAD